MASNYDISEQDQATFQAFTAQIKAKIAELGIDLKSKNLLEIQGVQMNKLLDLEKEFKKELLKHRWGPEVFALFIKKIVTPKSEGGLGNVLSSRPFVRENSEVCAGPMCKAIVNNNPKGLYKYLFNANFVDFALKVKPWSPNHKLRKIAKELHKIKQEIAITNMPLALSRARIFWAATFAKDPNRTVTYLDIIQLAALGLNIAINKFRPPFSVSFRNAIINRISSVFIEQYSNTVLHFFPRDRRKLYRANKFLKFVKDKSEVDYEEMADYVNLDLEPGQRTTASEIVQLLTAANIRSNDTPLAAAAIQKDGGNKKNLTSQIEEQPADGVCFNPENRFEEVESQHVMIESIRKLSFFDQKLLKLKGI